MSEEKVLTYAEFLKLKAFDGKYTEAQIKILWEAAFESTNCPLPTLKAAATLAWVIENSSYDDVLRTLNAR